MASGSAPSRLAVSSAFLAVYVIWGSTYLGIRLAVSSMPPFLMAAARWLAAGAILYVWRRAAGAKAPTLRHWRSGLVIGALLLVGGNGLLSWAEQIVPSGLAALLIALVPVWIALFLAAGARVRPGARVIGGLALGIVGVALIGGPAALHGGSLAGIGVILVGSVSWSLGSLYSRRAPLPEDVLLGASIEMLCGGALLLVAGLLTGETKRVDIAAVGPVAWASFAFLVLFGSIVGYSCYVWLLQVVRPEVVATYAFVNPVVAVALAAAVGDGSLTLSTLAAAALIVVGVAIVVTTPKQPTRAAEAATS